MDAMRLIQDAIEIVDATKIARFSRATRATEIRELGMDSVATMEMVAYIEDQLNVHFDEAILQRVTTIGDLVKLIEKHR